MRNIKFFSEREIQLSSKVLTKKAKSLKTFNFITEKWKMLTDYPGGYLLILSWYKCGKTAKNNLGPKILFNEAEIVFKNNLVEQFILIYKNTKTNENPKISSQVHNELLWTSCKRILVFHEDIFFNRQKQERGPRKSWTSLKKKSAR